MPKSPPDSDDVVPLLCGIDGNADYLIAQDRALTNLRASYFKPVIGKSEDLCGPFGA